MWLRLGLQQVSEQGSKKGCCFLWALVVRKVHQERIELFVRLRFRTGDLDVSRPFLHASGLERPWWVQYLCFGACCVPSTTRLPRVVLFKKLMRAEQSSGSLDFFDLPQTCVAFCDWTTASCTDDTCTNKSHNVPVVHPLQKCFSLAVAFSTMCEDKLANASLRWPSCHRRQTYHQLIWRCVVALVVRNSLRLQGQDKLPTSTTQCSERVSLSEGRWFRA